MYTSRQTTLGQIRCDFIHFKLVVDDFHDCLKITDKALGQKL